MSAAPSRTLRLLFRLDDVSNRTSSELEAEIFHAFRSRGIPLLLGVIPRVCSGDFADPAPQPLQPLSQEKTLFLRRERDLGAIEIAQHGDSHQTTETAARSRRTAEFQGIDRARQTQKITAGRAELATKLGRAPDCFIPPWNKYDGSTLHCLEQEGFASFSAGPNYGEVPPASRLRFVPSTTELVDLVLAVRDARSSPDASPLIVALFHPYDFEPQRTRPLSPEGLATTLDWVLEQEDIEIQSLGTLLATDEDLSLARYRSNARLRWFERLLPAWWRRFTRHRYYPSRRLANRLSRWSLLAIGGLLGLITTSGALVVGLGHSVTTASGWIDPAGFRLFALAIGIALVALAGRWLKSPTGGRRIYLRHAVVGAILFGLLIGTLSVLAH